MAAVVDKDHVCFLSSGLSIRDVLRMHYRRCRNSTGSTVSLLSQVHGSRTVTAGSDSHRPRSTYCSQSTTWVWRDYSCVAEDDADGAAGSSDESNFEALTIESKNPSMMSRSSTIGVMKFTRTTCLLPGTVYQ
jgi:hypothetical protein